MTFLIVSDKTIEGKGGLIIVCPHLKDHMSTFNWVFKYQLIVSQVLTQPSLYKRVASNLLAAENDPKHWIIYLCFFSDNNHPIPSETFINYKHLIFIVHLQIFRIFWYIFIFLIKTMIRIFFFLLHCNNGCRIYICGYYDSAMEKLSSI